MGCGNVGRGSIRSVNGTRMKSILSGKSGAGMRNYRIPLTLDAHRQAWQEFFHSCQKAQTEPLFGSVCAFWRPVLHFTACKTIYRISSRYRKILVKKTLFSNSLAHEGRLWQEQMARIMGIWRTLQTMVWQSPCELQLTRLFLRTYPPSARI